ncbi:hypothetical protein EXIGLDRAFT_444824 [Exidia glandulosa HHB12029]|uniref:Uncharacterized protein n=1 Tax=Exidia glandulosa HHB12029 TaxID=1314781 RepID=A0A165B6E5_EXIGL|nr:hypothetical protein EXIGLDRAFT_444824 [Exidia glandulosa HHB12029]
MRPIIIRTLLERVQSRTPPITFRRSLSSTAARHALLGALSIDRTFSDDDNLSSTSLSTCTRISRRTTCSTVPGELATCFPTPTKQLCLSSTGCGTLALRHYESAMLKARTDVQKYTQQEYSMWENHYVLAPQKLQISYILHDLAKNLYDKDLARGCVARRLGDTIESELNALVDVATLRRKVFFISLHSSYRSDSMKAGDVPAILTDATQLTLRKCAYLPSNPMHCAHAASTASSVRRTR